MAIHPSIDRLEPRLLLASAPAFLKPDGVLHVRGTAKADAIALSLHPKRANTAIVTVNGKTFNFTYKSIKAHFISAGAGNDSIRFLGSSMTGSLARGGTINGG